MQVRRALPPLILLAACAWALAAATAPSMAADANDDLAPHVAIRPAREALELAPGQQQAVEVVLKNDTPQRVRVEFRAIDLEAGTGDSFAQAATGDVVRSALEWLEFAAGPVTLEPRQELELPVEISVPADASPGAYAFAIAAEQTFLPIGVNSDDAPRSRVELKANVGSTFVVSVPGAVDPSAKIVSTSGPRLVWRDREPDFEVVAKNDGNTLLKLEAATELSSFGAFAGRTLKSDEQPTLPGGERTLQMTWSDRPWIGWFTPTVVVVGGSGSGVREEVELETVFVLPPWWVLVLLALAIALPVQAGRRRRRRIAAHRARMRTTAALERDDLDERSYDEAE